MALPSDPSRPHGRDEVVAALIANASRLFAERGPKAVALRDVAAEANVNLGLIHRYIGSKEDLLRAVLAARPGMPAQGDLSVMTAEELVELFLQLGLEESPYLTILLRAFLDGYEAQRMQDVFPLLERTARSVRVDLPRREADVRTALLAAALLGWHATAPLLLEVLKLKDLESDELADFLRPAIMAMLTAAPTTT